MEKENEAPAEEQVADVTDAPAAAKLLSADEIVSEIKPLSSNGFLAFFQKIWRAWLGVWYNFSEKHPKLSKLLYQIVFFIVFSEGVTIWQFLVMTFLPHAFAGLASVEFVWPAVNLGDLTYTLDGVTKPLQFAIFNEPAQLLADGTYNVNAGLGNFIAFEIAVFTAQIINFPLQRNITFKSKGNPYWQAMWYFIGWVLVSVFTNATWGIIAPFVRDLWAWPAAGWNLLKTVITGGLSMLVFFFIFLIIFPDANKVAKSARGKADMAKATNESEEKIAKLELKAVRKEEAAKLFNGRSERYQAVSVANSRAVAFEAIVRNTEKMKAEAKTDEEKAKAEAMEARISEYQERATVAIEAKRKAVAAYDKIVADVKAAREARGEDTSKVA